MSLLTFLNIDLFEIWSCISNSNTEYLNIGHEKNILYNSGNDDFNNRTYIDSL
ncbi:MAG: hypothetical protein JWP71_3149 [Mucilaginibacter sp.]|nr:hypothetical protein [Mucilaginibacter sp.]